MSASITAKRLRVHYRRTLFCQRRPAGKTLFCRYPSPPNTCLSSSITIKHFSVGVRHGQKHFSEGYPSPSSAFLSASITAKRLSVGLDYRQALFCQRPLLSKLCSVGILHGQKHLVCRCPSSSNACLQECITAKCFTVGVRRRQNTCLSASKSPPSTCLSVSQITAKHLLVGVPKSPSTRALRVLAGRPT